jgi:hypothetical protein
MAATKRQRRDEAQRGCQKDALDGKYLFERRKIQRPATFDLRPQEPPVHHVQQVAQIDTEQGDRRLGGGSTALKFERRKTETKRRTTP